MTDIISMLTQATQASNKAQLESNSHQSDSVASFFNSISKQSSTNKSSLPIQIKQQNTLESIERSVIPNQDTQNNNNASQNDLQNSPLAMFLSTNNFSSVQENMNSCAVLASAPKVQNTPPTFSTILQSQPPTKGNIPNGNGTGKEQQTKLITPNMLINSNNNNNCSNSNAGDSKKQHEPLTKNQMIQALKYLIENDDDFTKKVHDAYLKSLKN